MPLCPKIDRLGIHVSTQTILISVRRNIFISAFQARNACSLSLVMSTDHLLALSKLQVYVSCNPTKSLPADALILCCPVSNSTVGVPFRPVKVSMLEENYPYETIMYGLTSNELGHASSIVAHIIRND